MKKAILFFMLLATVITLLCGLLFLTIQQEIRSGANDEQTALAENTATLLESGVPADSIFADRSIDISRDTSPFVILFDQSGQLLGSDADLHGQTPVPPRGVIEYTRQFGQDRVTWQPESGVRVAAVVIPYGGSKPGFILAGRNIREFENRTADIVQLVVLGWLFSLAVLSVELILIFKNFKAELK